MAVKAVEQFVEEEAPKLISDIANAASDTSANEVSTETPAVDPSAMADATKVASNGDLSGSSASVGTIVNRFTNVAATKSAALATIQALDENNPETGVISLYVLEVANNPVLISNDLAYLDKKTSIAKKLKLRLDSAKAKWKTLLIVICTGLLSWIASNLASWIH